MYNALVRWECEQIGKADLRPDTDTHDDIDDAGNASNDGMADDDDDDDDDADDDAV